VFSEGLFSALAVCSSAASADLILSVSNDPGGASDEPAFGVAFFGFEPQSGTFGMSRHRFLISSMARNVTNCFPAIVSISSLFFAASRRNPETVIPPQGKAIRTASFKRSGVSAVIAASNMAPGGISQHPFQQKGKTRFLPVILVSQGF
jgi:hypothetical protein